MRQANRVGLYTKLVDELFTPYVYPQENGNRMDVRRVSVTNAQGTGLLAIGQPTLNFSLHRFTTEQLDAARHTHELRASGHLIWHLDYGQQGLGSCLNMKSISPQNELACEPFAFSLLLRPCSQDLGNGER
jgi:beta-galactosidase/evolved beta-galactosidase subunit alpha